MSQEKLTRNETDTMLAGVCGGIATYVGIDSALIRLLFVILLFASGIGFPIYMILWVIMPREGDTDKPNAEVIQDNIGEMSDTVSSSMNRIGRPGTMGVVLVLAGIFFLFNQLGWWPWVSGIFWPLIIIGAGIYMLSRRN